MTRDEMRQLCHRLEEENFDLREHVERLTRVITHVVYDSPGTPGSVKAYLSRALTGDCGAVASEGVARPGKETP